MRRTIWIGLASAVLALLPGLVSAEGLESAFVRPVSLQGVEPQVQETSTEVLLKGSAPFTYTTYETPEGTLVVEMPGVDLSGLDVDVPVNSPEVSRVALLTPEEVGTQGFSRVEVYRGDSAGEASVAVDPVNSRVVRVHVARREIPAEVFKVRAPGVPSDAPAEPEASAPFNPSIILNPRSDAKAPAGPAATELKDLRVLPSSDGVVLELQANGHVEYSLFELGDPNRVVVDLSGVHERVPADKIRIGKGAVQAVRLSQFRPEPRPVTRVVVDLNGPVDYRAGSMGNGLRIFLSENGAEALARMMEGFPGSAGSAPQSGPEDLLARAEMLGRPDPAEDEAAPGPELYETQGVMPAAPAQPAAFEARVIGEEEQPFVGRPISLDLRNAPLEDIFRLFHEISGLNIVVDPSVSGRTITIDVDNVPWDQLLDLILKTHGLGKSLEGNVLRIAPTQKFRAEEQERLSLETAREQSGKILMMTQTFSYARAEDAQTILQQFLSQRGEIIVDARTNTVIIRDIGKRLDEIKELIGQLDIPTQQVMIEARIVETLKNFQQAFGVQWGFNYVADRQHGNTTDYSFPHTVLLDGNAVTGGGLENPLSGYAVNLPVPGFNSAIGISLANILDTFQLDLAIMALESKGKARIISAPRIVAQNNESATIESGVQMPIVSTTAAEIDVRFVPASLRLIVTPQITAEDTVILDLQVENNSPSETVAVGGVPGITTRRAQTTVLVRNGGTTVIGGIYQVNESVSTSRVPVLHRIPLLGWLFKNRDRSTDNNELLIFVTPRILS